MTCSCRYIRRRPAVTRTRTTSPLTERKREVARRPDTAAIPTAWEYAPAPESREVVHLEDRYGLFIGGQFVEPLSNERYTTIDPAREAPLAEVAQAGKADVDRAVKAARDVCRKLVAYPSQRTREVPLPDRAHPSGALA